MYRFSLSFLSFLFTKHTTKGVSPLTRDLSNLFKSLYTTFINSKESIAFIDFYLRNIIFYNLSNQLLPIESVLLTSLFLKWDFLSLWIYNFTSFSLENFFPLYYEIQNLKQPSHYRSDLNCSSDLLSFQNDHL